MTVGAEVELVYRLTGAGWSEAYLRVGTAWTELTASYLDDALGDLVAAATLLPAAESTIRVSWAEEPGEFRWVLERLDDQLSVRVLWFDELRGSAPDDQGTLLLDETCELIAWLRAVATGARAVLEEWGEAGYREKWIDHDFPTATLLELEGIVATYRP